MKNTNIMLLLILAIAFSVRMIPAFWEPMAGIDSYYHLRLSEMVKENGLVNYDPISQGGRIHNYPPGIHILIAGASFLADGKIAGHVLLSIFGSFIVLSGFLISKKLYNEKAGIAASLLLVFSVVSIWATGSITNDGIAAGIFSLSALCFVYKRIRPCIAITFALLIFSPFFAVFASVIFAAFTDNKKIRPIFLLIIAIALFFYIKETYLYTSNALPEYVKNAIFPNLSAYEIIIRLTPFMLLSVLGLMFCRKDKFLIAWTFLLAILSFIIEPNRILFYISLPLSILAGGFLSQRRRSIYGIFLILIIISGLFSANYALMQLKDVSMSSDEYEAFTWIRDNSPSDSVILATPMEGHWINSVSKRKNVVDGYLFSETEERLDDAYKIYTDGDELLIRKYNISYVVFSRFSPARFNATIVFEKGTTTITKV